MIQQSAVLASIFFSIMIFFSCEKKQITSETSLQIKFTDITTSSGLAGFQHETGAVGDKWFPESMGGGGAGYRVAGTISNSAANVHSQHLRLTPLVNQVRFPCR